MPPEKLLSCPNCPFCNGVAVELSGGDIITHHKDDCFIKTRNPKHWATRTPSPELIELRRDKERLDWLLDFITVNGSNGIADLLWTNIADSDPMEEDDLIFDRAAIDAAIKEKK